MPHLFNVYQTKIRCASSCRAITYSASRHTTSTSASSGPEERQSDLLSEFEGNTGDKPWTVHYTLVSDINPEFIRRLDGLLAINPEFYEAHLHRSGYVRDYELDPSPETWNTQAFPKNFISIGWLRPVYQSSAALTLNADRKALIEDEINTSSLQTQTDNDKFDRVETSTTLRLMTNIFRNGFPMVTNPEVLVDTRMEDHDMHPAAWEEQITINVHRMPDGKINVCILLDPLPTLMRTKTITYSRKGGGRGPRPFTSPRIVELFESQRRSFANRDLDFQGIFDGTAFSPKKLQKLEQMLSQEKVDTLGDLQIWLDSSEKQESGTASISAILKIIEDDTVGLIAFVKDILVKIDRDATQDFLLQNRLAHWRSMLTVLKHRMLKIIDDIPRLASFLVQSLEIEAPTAFERRMYSLLSAANEDIDKTQRSLRENMALLENKRGIDQSESVGKLTELGFIFIPVSCVASLFSMQIDLLSGGVSLWYFVVGSILVIALVYSARLSIRSSIFLSFKAYLGKSIRQQSGLRGNAHIPTRIFLRYFVNMGPLREMNTSTNIRNLAWVLVVGVLIMPASFLWSRPSLDAGFKAAVFVGFFMIITFPLSILFEDVLHKAIAKRRSQKDIYIKRSADRGSALVRPRSSSENYLAKWWQRLRAKAGPKSNVEAQVGIEEAIAGARQRSDGSSVHSSASARPRISR